uniref:Uncharacterized protein n=1 Tax=Tanacetum cinerariifolium TaxID=118510 RepID=A0A6L2P0S0_TANCI|nr:hypothetical protein [Tanacetum cinerariifolium]
METQPEITQNISSLKLPMLKTGDYDLWSMRMEQYLTQIDYALWEVIINAVATVVPPKTEAQKLARKNESKAKSTLLLAIPDEHLLNFHSIQEVKSLWEAIKIRFGGNKESNKIHKTILKQQYENFVASRSEGLDKTYDRFQKLISQLELNGEVISQEDANMKLLRSLPLAWSYQADNGPTDFALMAHSSDSANSSNSEKKEFVFIKRMKLFLKKVLPFLKYDVQVRDVSIKDLKNQLEETMKENNDLKEKLTKFEESSKNLTKLINSQMSANDKTGLGYDSQLSENEMPKCNIFETASDSSVSEIDEDNNQAKDRYKVGIGYHAVPPPYTGNYMPPRADLSFAGLDDSVFKFKISETRTSVNGNESIASKSSEETGEEPKTVREVRPVWNNARRVNHQNFFKMTHPHPKRNFVPTAVATKSGQVLVNTAKQNSAASTSTAKPMVNTDTTKPNVNVKSSYFKPHFPKSRHFNQRLAAKTNTFLRKINTAKGKNVTIVGPKAVVNAAEGKKKNVVKSSACRIWRPKRNLIDHTSKDSRSYTLKRFNYVDPNGRLKSAMAWVPKRN